MKRPSFQFYPADWRSSANLRRCSEAARGAWMDVLCLLHDSEEYGVLRWPLTEIARASGIKPRLLRELVDKAVLKGADKGAGDYVWAPTHAGKKGEDVVLVVAGDGPCWYSSRFVRDEYVRQRRGSGSRFDSENQPPKQQPNATPKVAIGGRQGDGASASSASASSLPHEVLSNHPPSAEFALEGAFEGHVDPKFTPQPAVQFAMALRSAGFPATSLTPSLAEYAEAGGTIEHLLEVAQLTNCQGKNGAYVAKAALGQLLERATPITAGDSRGTRRNESAAERTRRLAIEGDARDQQAAFASAGGADLVGADG